MVHCKPPPDPRLPHHGDRQGTRPARHRLHAAREGRRCVRRRRKRPREAARRTAAGRGPHRRGHGHERARSGRLHLIGSQGCHRHRRRQRPRIEPHERPRDPRTHGGHRGDPHPGVDVQDRDPLHHRHHGASAHPRHPRRPHLPPRRGHPARLLHRIPRLHRRARPARGFRGGGRRAASPLEAHRLPRGRLGVHRPRIELRRRRLEPHVEARSASRSASSASRSSPSAPRCPNS